MGGRMVSVEVAGARFNLRAGGVCLHEGQVLVQQATWEESCALPGGRIETMEASEVALRREMREELGCDITIERLLWVVENFFEYEGKSAHEIGFYYLFSLPLDAPAYAARDPFTCLDAPDVIYRWEPLATLADLDLRPRFLKQALLALPAAPTHVVNEGR